MLKLNLEKGFLIRKNKGENSNNKETFSKIYKEKEKNEKYKNKLTAEIESLNTKIRLENKILFKDSIIKGLIDNYEQIGCIQEKKRYRFINEEMNQSDIDKYFTKHLAYFQQSLLTY